MEIKHFKFEADILSTNSRKYIDLDDLLVALYEASSQGFNVINVKDLTDMLKELRSRK